MSAAATTRRGKGKLIYTYERDIVCLPKWFAKRGDVIKIPRKKPMRHFLAVNKLLGKIQLNSSMGEDEIFDVPMDGDSGFPVQDLATIWR